MATELHFGITIPAGFAATMPVNAQPATTNGRAVTGIAVAHEENSGSCCGFLTSIPKAIANFWSHQWADLHMYGRAFVSMGHGTTADALNRGQQEVLAFAQMVRDTDP